VSSNARVAVPIAYGLLLGAALFLCFYRLDARLLWGDEAETATLARNVLHFGVPKTSDGLNEITLLTVLGRDVVASKDGVWTWSPWLQEYVAAASFAVFGPTTWAARAPFALIGWLAVVATGWLAFRIYRSHAIALAAIALLSSSEVFLLHARQCRYYSIIVLAEVVLVFAFHQLLIGRRSGAFALAGALIAQFYSNYIVVAANVPALILFATLLYFRQRRSLPAVILAGAGFGLAALPWLLYAHPARQAGFVAADDFWPKLAFYAREFHFHFLPWTFALLPAAGWVLSRVRSAPSELPTVLRTFEWLLSFLLLSSIGVLVQPPGHFLRYMLMVLPVGCLLASAWTVRHIRARAAAALLITVVCLTNGLALATAYPWRGGHTLHWPLAHWLLSLHRPYESRLNDVVQFLRKEARPGQTVFVFDPELPLMFYTGLKIIDGRQDRGELPGDLPDWVFSESVSGVMSVPPSLLPESLAAHYRAISLPVHNSRRMGVIPEPDVYEYESAGLTDLLIYKKR
jgi:hypothetical protein